MITRHCQLYIVGVYLTSKASQSAIKFPNCNRRGRVNGDASVGIVLWLLASVEKSFLLKVMQPKTSF